MSVGMVRDEVDSTTPRVIMHLENIFTANINVKPNIGLEWKLMLHFLVFKII